MLTQGQFQHSSCISRNFNSSAAVLLQVFVTGAFTSLTVASSATSSPLSRLQRAAGICRHSSSLERIPLACGVQLRIRRTWFALVTIPRDRVLMSSGRWEASAGRRAQGSQQPAASAAWAACLTRLQPFAGPQRTRDWVWGAAGSTLHPLSE